MLSKWCYLVLTCHQLSTVDHTTLLKQLAKHCGMKGNILSLWWITSFLMPSSHRRHGQDKTRQDWACFVICSFVLWLRFWPSLLRLEPNHIGESHSNDRQTGFNRIALLTTCTHIRTLLLHCLWPRQSTMLTLCFSTNTLARLQALIFMVTCCCYHPAWPVTNRPISVKIFPSDYYRLEPTVT